MPSPLQEVTPLIYGLFCCSPWWDRYTASPCPAGVQYFTVLLWHRSVGSVRGCDQLPFSNSVMGELLYHIMFAARAHPCFHLWFTRVREPSQLTTVAQPRWPLQGATSSLWPAHWAAGRCVWQPPTLRAQRVGITHSVRSVWPSASSRSQCWTGRPRAMCWWRETW